MAEAVRSSNLGRKRNSKPSVPPGKVKPRIANTNNNTIITGIIIFDQFSIPSFTPFTIT